MTPTTNDPRVPFTVLTGYLGAGKTTLLNRILSEKHGKRYAVIVNEFGEEGIDGALVVGADEEVFEMNNGCVCCTVRGDLIRVVAGLLKRAQGFDGILLETTGLADPAPVIQTFFADPDIASKARLDSVVTVADAKHLADRLADSKEAMEQIAFADVIILNKTDLASRDELDDLEDRIREINGFSSVIRAQRCDAPLEKVIGLGTFDLERILAHTPELLEDEPDSHHHHHEHGHECGADCHHHHHHRHEPECKRHNPEITSISLKSEKPMNADKFDAWISDLRANKGGDLLRYKGIIAFSGSDDRFVLQGVHMMVEGENVSPWPEKSPRVSRLVFIGRNLDAEGLEKEFLSCQA